MLRNAFTTTVAVLVLLGCRTVNTMAAENSPPKPTADTGGAEKPSKWTPEYIEQLRQQGWKKPWIPGPEDIESITAEAYSNFLPIADVPPFVIPKKYYGELLDHFHNAEPDKLADTHNEELGTLRITLVGGRSMRICWFWGGQGDRLRFSWCGMRYRATGERFSKDETLKIDSIVRRIHSIEILHEDGQSTPIVLPQTR